MARNASASAAPSSGTQTFNSTGGEQIFQVPDGVTNLNVLAVGGKGGNDGGTSSGGFGASARADIAVAPGQILFIEVGGNGGALTAGFNGGGAGGSGNPTPTRDGGGGGGATDIRTTSRAAAGNPLASRLIIAAGGGGAGGDGETAMGGVNPGGSGGQGAGFANGNGGHGGNGSSCMGTGIGAQGGEQNQGGLSVVQQGSLGQGGNGGNAPGSTGVSPGGGGGGGGKFGGGGGQGCGGVGGGGGGGAGSTSFAATATSTSFQADPTGVPLVVLTYNTGGGSGLEFGKVKRNKSKGTAILPVTVPGTGTLSLGGKGIVKKRPSSDRWGIRLAREIAAAGTYNLKIKTKGRKKEKLFDTGTVKVKAIVTFKPTSGDAVQDSKRVKLKKS